MQVHIERGHAHTHIKPQCEHVLRGVGHRCSAAAISTGGSGMGGGKNYSACKYSPRSVAPSRAPQSTSTPPTCLLNGIELTSSPALVTWRRAPQSRSFLLVVILRTSSYFSNFTNYTALLISPCLVTGTGCICKGCQNTWPSGRKCPEPWGCTCPSQPALATVLLNSVPFMQLRPIRGLLSL